MPVINQKTLDHVSTVALLKYILPGDPMPGHNVSPPPPELGKRRDPNGLELGFYNSH